MSRTLAVWTVVSLLLASTGCRMCDHPYAYSGPTVTGACSGQSHPTSRTGSILSNASPTSPESEILAGQVLSITDKKVEEPTKAEPRKADQAPVETSKGWKAYSPTTAPAKRLPAVQESPDR